MFTEITQARDTSRPVGPVSRLLCYRCSLSTLVDLVEPRRSVEITNSSNNGGLRHHRVWHRRAARGAVEEAPRAQDDRRGRRSRPRRRRRGRGGCERQPPRPRRSGPWPMVLRRRPCTTSTRTATSRRTSKKARPRGPRNPSPSRVTYPLPRTRKYILIHGHATHRRHRAGAVDHTTSATINTTRSSKAIGPGACAAATSATPASSSSSEKPAKVDQKRFRIIPSQTSRSITAG